MLEIKHLKSYSLFSYSLSLGHAYFYHYYVSLNMHRGADSPGKSNQCTGTMVDKKDLLLFFYYFYKDELYNVTIQH